MPENLNNEELSLSDLSCKIAEKYISSVLLVDDNISYNSSQPQSSCIAAEKFIDDFAAKNINACLYLWKNENQIDNILKLVRNNDVSILDWKIGIQKQVAEEDMDKDCPDDGGRGGYTKELLQRLIDEQPAVPRLLIIYTEEISEVQNYLKSLSEEYSESNLPDDYTWISKSKCVKISLYFKEGIEGIYNVPAERIIKYENLPAAIIKNFAEMHEGILPLALLRSLTVIRENTGSLLNMFNNDLDSAFVLHQALSPNPEDADNLLIQTISDAFSSLYIYQNMPNLQTSKLVEAWINEQSVFLKNDLVIKRDFYSHVNPIPQPVQLDITIEDRKRLLADGYITTIQQKYVEVTNDTSNDALKIIEENDKKQLLFPQIQGCFSLNNVDMKKANCDFSILTHHKSIFEPATEYYPWLMSGCIIKLHNREKYLLCIQQACDCLRIPSSGRKFLFLPLEKSPQNFDIVLKNNDSDEMLTLAVRHKTSYNIEILDFKPDAGDTVIKAKKEDQKMCFKTKDGKKYFWLCDLKEDFYLKIINEYAQKLTRVGIEQSEWLRRS